MKFIKKVYEAFEKNDFFFASKKFFEAELNFEKPEYCCKICNYGKLILFIWN